MIVASVYLQTVGTVEQVPLKRQVMETFRQDSDDKIPNKALKLVSQHWENENVLGDMTGPSNTASAIFKNEVGSGSTKIYAKPLIFVVPEKAISFANRFTEFTIQTFKITSTPTMFEVIAESPSGQQFQCQIEKKVSADLDSTLETFKGYFKAEEVGLYTIRVTLLPPFKNQVLGDTVDVLISRNYTMESKKMPAVMLQLELTEHEELPYGRTIIKSSKAWGIACDKPTNLIYITERVGNQVSCMDSQGNIRFRFNQEKPESQLNRPSGICCDEQNRRVIVCDKGNHRICFFTMDGQYLSSFGKMGNEDGELFYPWGVDVTSRNETRIVVADARNRRIQIFDGFGNFLSKFCPFEQHSSAQKPRPILNYPRGVSFDPDGELVYVSDFKTKNVVKVGVNVATCKKLLPSGKLSRPGGLIVDQIGNFLVVDSRGNCILHCDGEGEILSKIHSVGSTNLQYPVNLTLMRDGVVAVLDGRGRILIF